MHDFALVATYLPILSLTLRATLLVSFMFWCMDSAQLHFAGILALSASIVYLDSLVFRTQMDTAAGHLCLCGLAVLSQKHSQQCSDTGSLMLLPRAVVKLNKAVLQLNLNDLFTKAAEMT